MKIQPFPERESFRDSGFFRQISVITDLNQRITRVCGHNRMCLSKIAGITPVQLIIIPKKLKDLFK